MKGGGENKGCESYTKENENERKKKKGQKEMKQDRGKENTIERTVRRE